MKTNNEISKARWTRFVVVDCGLEYGMPTLERAVEVAKKEGLKAYMVIESQEIGKRTYQAISI